MDYCFSPSPGNNSGTHCVTCEVSNHFPGLGVSLSLTYTHRRDRQTEDLVAIYTPTQTPQNHTCSVGPHHFSLASLINLSFPTQSFLNINASPKNTFPPSSRLPSTVDSPPSHRRVRKRRAFTSVLLTSLKLCFHQNQPWNALHRRIPKISLTSSPTTLSQILSSLTFN